MAAHPQFVPVDGDPDTDQDGLPDAEDSCPVLHYDPGFDWQMCGPMDLDPDNDARPECKAREHIALKLVDPNDGAFIRHIAFAVIKNGVVHFADAFTYVGQGQYVHDPEGIYRLYRIGSTSKSIVAAAAVVLDEDSVLSLDDFVDDEDATQQLDDGDRTLGQLLCHQGAFKLDSGALHLFCYIDDLIAFWLEPDDLVSPHYDSEVYGNLGGGFEYSAFNYSLAGAYMVNKTGETFEHILQTRIFDPTGMCTASLDGTRAVGTPIGYEAAVSQGPVMHVGPYINLVSPTDDRCVDNFYSSDDLPGDDYTFQYYHLDEASAEARDPAGGVIASVIDVAHFAEALLDSYHNPGGLLSQAGVRHLWEKTSDLMCDPNCPYERFYGVGFFTNTLPGEPVTQVGHGGSRAGYTSAFVLRPETGLAISILANADAGTVSLSDLAKTILDDFQFHCPADFDNDGQVGIGDLLRLLGAWGTPVGDVDGDGDTDTADLLALLGAWGECP